MQFSDEELISFLLDDASEPLVESIKAQLASDSKNAAELVDRLSHLRMILGHMDAVNTRYEPPADLIDKTLARIEAADGEDRDEDGREKYAHPEEEFSGHPSPATPVAILRPLVDPPRQSRRFWDSTALAISLSLLCCLALPALVGARFEARKAQCAQNLRLTGMGLIDYSMLAPDARFPSIATSGPTAFAGVYSIHLNEAGLLDSIQQLQCPSLPTTDHPFASLSSQRPGSTETHSDFGFPSPSVGFLPTLAQLHDLPAEQLRIFRVHAGGDYAYNLGVIEDSRPVAPRNSGRSYFAILGDAPVLESTFVSGSIQAGSSANEPSESFQAHDGRGINILYEDGRVQFLSIDYLQSLPARVAAIQNQALDTGVHSRPQSIGGAVTNLLDHPLRNTHGQRQVGLNPQDASLAPSYVTPLGL